MKKIKRTLFALFFALSAVLASTGFTVHADSKYANWNEVVDAMEVVLEDAYTAYEQGDLEKAYAGINDAYYGYYEVTGFERVAMGYISGARKSEMELQFSACKTVIKNDAGKESVRAEITKLENMLREDANILDGKTGEASSSGWATFIACFSILLREGLEAILIVGAIIAYLVKTGHQDKLGPVYIGSILAIVASFIAAWLLYQFKLANSASQEIIEGVTALLAVVVLIYVSNWMISKSEAEAWNKYIEGQVQAGVEKGNLNTLGFTAFLAVFREGAEVILFYQPLLADKANSKTMIWAGFIAAAIVLVLVYIAVRYFSVRLPLKPFFTVTSIFMSIMAVSFLGSGIKELIEGDVISMTPIPWIPSNQFLEVLGIYPCVETVVPQIILTIALIASYVIHKKRSKKLKAEAAA
ncbi:MAG: FTR1 family iron permease [Faecalicoccus sp.]|nr:FTR1 family iron permease [Faecalicoccus sp.]